MKTHDFMLLSAQIQSNKKVWYTSSVYTSVQSGQCISSTGLLPDGLRQIIDSLKKEQQTNFVREDVSSAFLTAQELDFLQIPSSEMITVSVTVEASKKINPVWSCDNSLRVDIGQKIKILGNEFVKKKNYKDALDCFRLGSDYLSTNVKLDETDFKSRDILVAILSNAALCLLKLEELQKGQLRKTSSNEKLTKADLLIPCISSCQKALDLKPTFTKASFRLAMALSKLLDFEEAVSVLTNAIENIPKDETVTNAEELRTSFESLIAKWNQANDIWQKEKLRVCQKVRQQAYSSENADKPGLGYKELPHYFRRLYAKKEAAELNKNQQMHQDSEEEDDKLLIDTWSNSLADNMISIEEELEAFGEKMPERRSYRNSSRQLENLDEEGADFSDDDSPMKPASTVRFH